MNELLQVHDNVDCIEYYTVLSTSFKIRNEDTFVIDNVLFR